MESHEELLTLIQDLKAAQRAKHKGEKKEEARLEELKVRLRIRLDRNGKPSNDTPASKTA